jgi:hypothetical protein
MRQEAKPPVEQKPEASAAGVRQAIFNGGTSGDGNDGTITTPKIGGAVPPIGKKRKASSSASGGGDALPFSSSKECEFFFDLTSGDNFVHSALFEKVGRAGRDKMAQVSKILGVISAEELAATSAGDDHYVPDSALRARFAFFHGQLSSQQMAELCKLLGVDPSGAPSPSASANGGGDAVSA